jgi:hypothetical protein
MPDDQDPTAPREERFALDQIANREAPARCSRPCDENGEGWEALFTLERQADGSLKITGCTLLKAGQAV